ncbi:MAG: hypothetical protein ING36_15020 [Burkholderiales bacterium]|jgi:CRISPR-associated protein Csm5|nr:hypothetical protein [Burkholderiales bacterium]
MKPFLRHHRLHLTPLSPIHIGSGEDFEPTNYIIEDRVLYSFDPSQAMLTEAQRARLQADANRASLLGLQSFFRDNSALFKPHARVLIPVSTGVASHYEKNIGRAVNTESQGNQVFNRFMIERTQYSGLQAWPYIPGSSFKGCLRTGLLDELNQSQPVTRPDELQNGRALINKVEQRLLNGDFSTSPLRLLKPGDFMPCYEPARRIMYAVNRKKERILKNGIEIQAKGLTARKESILHGQYRLFGADLVLTSVAPHQHEKPTRALEQLATLAPVVQASNRYHLERFHNELALLAKRGFVDPVWQRSVEQLFSGALGSKLQAGQAMLVRLGRYGGAESKTLSGRGVAKIKINQGTGKPPIYSDSTKTVWLAAEQEQDQTNMLPFGWAIVEIDPQNELEELKTWCQQQSRARPDMQQLRASFEAEKEQAARRKAEQQAEADARAAAALAEKLAEEQRQQALQALPPRLQDVEKLRQQCEQWQQKMASSNFRKQSADPNRAGLYQDATRLVKAALETPDWSAEEKLALANMLEQHLSQVVGPWDAKEQRKKLRLAQLRGQT